MTDTEAVEFRRQLMQVHFPGLLAWWETLPASAETWRVWRDCLRPYTLEECLSVVCRWSDGTLQPFEAYERERVHLIIRAIIERDRSKQRAQASSQALCAPVIAKPGTPVAPVLARAVQMAVKGHSEQEIQSFIDSSFPTRPEYDQPSYHCLACYDRGLVEIWHPAEVKRFTQGLKDQPTCFCSIACSCCAGQRELHKDYHRSVKYDPASHCRVVGWHSIEQKRNTLRTWLEERKRIDNHPRYEPAFSEFA